MRSKVKIKGLFNKISSLSGRNFISSSKEMISQVPGMLDSGSAQSAADKMKEIIELCESKKKENDRDFDWVCSMACCLYAYSFCRFGRKVEDFYLNKAQEISNDNNFTDVLFWINICKLYNMVTSGRTGHFKETLDEISEILTKVSEPDADNYRLQLLPDLAMHALNKGDLGDANRHADELISLAGKMNNANSVIQGNIISSRIMLASERLKEAIISINDAISSGKDAVYEQLIPALYTKAQVLITQDNFTEAKTQLDMAKKKLEETLDIIDTSYHVNIGRLYGSLYANEEIFDEAEEQFTQSLRMAQKMDSPLEEGITHLMLGELFMRSGKYDKAALSLEEASGKFIIIDNQFMLSRTRKLREGLEIEKSKMSSAKSSDITSKKPVSSSSHHVNALDDFMKIAISNLDLDTVLKNVIDHIMRVTDADRGFIVLINEEGELYSHVMRAKQKADEKNADLIKKFSRSITDRVLKTHEPILVNDIKDDQAFATAQSIVGLDIRSAVCVPLSKDKKEIIGLIYIDRQAFVGAFTQDDLALLQSLAGYAAIAVSNARLHSGVQKKLEKTQEQLIQSEKLATIGTLAGGVAHEINTPLGAILNNAEMLMMDALSEEQKESLELIKLSTLKCKTIVEQLLKYSRKSNFETEKADINSIINDACVMLAHQFSDVGIKIQKDLSELPEMNCNPTELSQVMTNIFINARDAILERKVTLENKGLIFIKTYLENNLIVVEAADNGCGISEKDMGKIFDPFFTTKEVGKGTGLGLSIVEKIIDRHGGRIEVRSKPGEGATIILKFII